MNLKQGNFIPLLALSSVLSTVVIYCMLVFNFCDNTAVSFPCKLIQETSLSASFPYAWLDNSANALSSPALLINKGNKHRAGVGNKLLYQLLSSFNSNLRNNFSLPLHNGSSGLVNQVRMHIAFCVFRI